MEILLFISANKLRYSFSWHSRKVFILYNDRRQRNNCKSLRIREKDIFGWNIQPSEIEEESSKYGPRLEIIGSAQA